MAAIKSLSVSFINMGQQVSRLIVSLLTVSWFSFFGYVGKASLGAKKPQQIRLGYAFGLIRQIFFLSIKKPLETFFSATMTFKTIYGDYIATDLVARLRVASETRDGLVISCSYPYSRFWFGVEINSI